MVVLLVAAAAGLAGQDPVNVNSRYVVESVDVSDGGKLRISRGLREDIEKLVGSNLNPRVLDRLARRLRTELRARAVTHKVVRGSQPEHVVVLFEVAGRRPKTDLDVRMSKGVYHAKSGWSGALDSTVRIGDNEFLLGVVSDGDELLERFTGVRAGYERTRAGMDRVRAGFRFASYHQKWNPATQAALESASGVPGVYRTRQDFAPSVTVVLAEPLTLTAGTSFQRFQTQFPAARMESANAVTTTLRYARRVEDSHNNQHEVKAGYSLRAATRSLGSDFAYAQHVLTAGYTLARGRHALEAELLAGRAGGAPPLFDRFVLGNSRTLRGWNKFDLNPLGGTRVVHGSLEYRYRCLQLFYDVGSLWNDGEDAGAKHSLGIGIRSKGGFYLAMAFPLRTGRTDPVLLMGTHF